MQDNCDCYDNNKHDYDPKFWSGRGLPPPLSHCGGCQAFTWTEREKK